MLRLLWLAVCAGTGTQTKGQQPIISSLGQNGLLESTNLEPGTVASVEWGPSVSGPWTNTWESLSAVRVDQNGAIRVSVPMFYRLRGIPAGTVLSVSNMVYIPPGTFVMGSPASERERRDDEMQHTVTLTQGFWMGRHEVSQEEYWGVMGSNPSYWRNGQSAFGSGGEVTNDLRHPVELVSWNDATNYCGGLTTRERAAGRIPANYRYRLPTEAEWEYACRGGTTNAFHYGKALRGTMANLDARFEYDADVGTISTSNYFGRTSVVGSSMPNGFGLYDMHGNVWEWCGDRYGTYPFGPVSDPHGPVLGSNRVFRGGSWFSFGNHCRSAFRYWFDPEYRFTDLGLRVVLAPSPQ